MERRGLWNYDGFSAGFENSADIPVNWEEIIDVVNALLGEIYDRADEAEESGDFEEMRRAESEVKSLSMKLWETFCATNTVCGVSAEYDWVTKLVREKKDDILEKLEDAYHSALFCSKMQFTVYIWEDGDITILEDVAGGSLEPENLHYWKPGMLHCLDLATFCFRGYDWTAIAENPLVNFEDEIEYHADEDAAYKKWISDAGDDVDEGEKLDWLFRHAIETECAIKKDFVDEDVANIDFEEEYLSAWI